MKKSIFYIMGMTAVVSLAAANVFFTAPEISYAEEEEAVDDSSSAEEGTEEDTEGDWEEDTDEEDTEDDGEDNDEEDTEDDGEDKKEDISSSQETDLVTGGAVTDVKDTGNFEDNTEKEPEDIGNVEVAAVKNQIYNKGKEIKPSLVVTSDGDTLVENEDYELSYSENKKVGTASVLIKGIHDYTGTKTVTFEICPAKPSIVAKSAKKGQADIIINGKNSGVTKFEITYKSGSDSGKKAVKAGKTRLKLKSGKKYSVKVRAVGQKKNYSSYATASIKVK